MQTVFGEITRGTFPVVDKGHMTLSARPGLGITMDWEPLDRQYPYRSQSLRPPGGR